MNNKGENMRKIRKLSLISLTLLLACTMSGCGANEKTATESEEIKKAIQKLDETKSYHYVISAEGDGLPLIKKEDGTAELSDRSYKVDKKIMKKDESIYSIENDIYDHREMAGLKVIADDVTMLDFTLIEEQHAELSDFVTRDITFELKNEQSVLLPFLEDGEYAKYYTISSETKDDNKIYTISCNDVKAYDEACIKAAKDKNPNYDPLEEKGQKLTKKELLKEDFTVTINKDGYITELVCKVETDYGDNLIGKLTSTERYSDFDKIELDTDYIDILIKDRQTGKTNEGDVVDLKELAY